jgi:hypothetical protein
MVVRSTAMTTISAGVMMATAHVMMAIVGVMMVIADVMISAVTVIVMGAVTVIVMGAVIAVRMGVDHPRVVGAVAAPLLPMLMLPVRYARSTAIQPVRAGGVMQTVIVMMMMTPGRIKRVHTVWTRIGTWIVEPLIISLDN